MPVDSQGFLYGLAFTIGELLWIFAFTAACVLIILSPLISYLLKRKK